ncbi:hypothetical protein DPMN_133445 [Dreissena polymorpha]|uniref:Uncharacterized protein n=1 Tax=Dreissena polymorpha TaxID=45954 RepID=A0A9D4FUC5_DREPO|nr:hypothetical protein DPMN_133445 [Dreissena polymorpha]
MLLNNCDQSPRFLSPSRKNSKSSFTGRSTTLNQVNRYSLDTLQDVPLTSGCADASNFRE